MPSKPSFNKICKSNMSQLSSVDLDCWIDAALEENLYNEGQQTAQMHDVSTQAETDKKTHIITEKGENFTGRTNHCMWQILLKLYKTLCIAGATFFGGCIRDYYARMHAIKQFYDYCAQQGIDRHNADKHFNKSSFHPETFAMRTLLPNDLDIFCIEKDQEKILSILGERFNCVENTTTHQSYFINQNEIHTVSLIHRRFKCSLFDSSIQKILRKILSTSQFTILFAHAHIKIDLIILRNEYAAHDNENARILRPPFGKPDFRCNMLYMKSSADFDTSPKIYIMEDYVSKFSGISPKAFEHSINYMCEAFALLNTTDVLKNIVFKDIIEKRAVIINGNISMYRVKKMIAKGYDITYKEYIENTLHSLYGTQEHYIPYNKILVKTTITTTDAPATEPVDFVDDGEKCIICMETFASNEEQIHYGCKCSAKYHMNCLAEYVKSQVQNVSDEDDTNDLSTISCPNCRRLCSCLCDIAWCYFATKHNTSRHYCDCVICKNGYKFCKHCPQSKIDHGHHILFGERW